MASYGSKDKDKAKASKTEKGSGSKGKGDGMPVLYPTNHRPRRNGNQGQSPASR